MAARAWIASAAAAAALVVPASAWAAASLYVGGYGSNQVGVLDIGADGQVTPRPGATVSTEVGPSAIAMTPDGRFLFTSNDGGSIGRYAVGADRGLSLLGNTAAPPGTSPYGNAVTPDGRFLYVVLADTDDIAGYSIGSDGSLTMLPGLPVDAPADNVAVSTDGRTLFVTDASSSQLRAFRIGGDGSLTQLPGSPVASAVGIYEISVTPDGRFLYGAEYDGDAVRGWSLAPDGTPTPFPGAPFTLPNGPYAGLVPSPDSRSLFVTAYDTGAIHSLAIAADGTLSQVGSPLPLVDEATSAAITPDGRFLYATAFTTPAPVYEFSVGASGGLAELQPTPASTGVNESDIESMTITPNQGPLAASRMTVDGKRAKLDATGSSDPNGTIASYAWDFGDGETATTSEPKTTHKFDGKPAPVTLTVTDNDGCAATRIYTGQDTLCNTGGAGTLTNPGVAGARIKAKRSQRQDETVLIAVRVRAGEDGGAIGKGKITVTDAKKAVALKKVRAKLKAGKRKTLRLRAKSAAAGQRLAAQLADGAKAKAKLSVTLKDVQGNRVRQRLSVRLTG